MADFLSLIPDELKLPHLSYNYFATASSHPFQADATEFNLANAAWLTDLAFLVYGDKNFITAQAAKVGLTGTPQFFGFDETFESTQFAILHNAEIIVVVFRGTEFNPLRILNGLLDTVVDVRASFAAAPELGGLVHKGMWKNAEEIFPQLKNAFAEIRTTQSVWFAGHSLGAALAVLAAKLYAVRERKSVQGIYTIGCPRVGDQQFATHYQLPLFRLINNQDPVTKIPTLGKAPNSLFHTENYASLGEIIFFDEAGALSHADNRSAITSNLLLGGLTLGGSLLAQMFDHAPFRYSQKIWNHLPS